jgi:hypothetical protein
MASLLLGSGFTLIFPLVYTQVQWYKIQSALSDPTHQEGGGSLKAQRARPRQDPQTCDDFFVIEVTVLEIYCTTPFPTVSYVCIRGTITWKSIHKLSPEGLLYAGLEVMRQAFPLPSKSSESPRKDRFVIGQRYPKVHSTGMRNVRGQLEKTLNGKLEWHPAHLYISNKWPLHVIYRARHRICHDRRLSEYLRKDEVGPQLWHQDWKVRQSPGKAWGFPEHISLFSCRVFIHITLLGTVFPYILPCLHCGFCSNVTQRGLPQTHYLREQYPCPSPFLS